MSAGRDPLTWIGCLMAAAGVVWLGPLIFDQLVFFGDQRQTADAAAARAIMPLPSVLLGAGAALISSRRRRLHAGLAALPLLAVLLAWAMPESAYQLVTYAVSAPIAVGALLAASIPLRGPIQVAVPIAVGVGAVALLGVTEFGLLAAIALIAWWALSRLPRPAGDTSALD